MKCQMRDGAGFMGRGDKQLSELDCTVESSLSGSVKV
jgi:hypothetical protein